LRLGTTAEIYGIKNLTRWFPVIWKDKDWDQHFIWEVMIQKLKFQAKYIGERDIHTRAKRDAEIMMTCVRLMERIQEEYYIAERFDYEYFKKYPLIYKKIKQQHPDKSKSTISFYMSYENHNGARKILFKLMEHNIESWWD